jgi:hypothetical protein
VAKIVHVPTPDGGSIEGQEVEFTPVQEPWSTYRLEDGYGIRFKAIVTQVIRTEKRDQDGNPVYMVRSSNVLAVSPPETFRKKEVQ